MDPGDDSAPRSGAVADGVSARRSALAGQSDAPLPPSGFAHGDISIDDFCSIIVERATTQQATASAALVIDVEQQRGFSLPYDTPVALCVLRYYPRLSHGSIVTLMTTIRDGSGSSRFLERMARDTLRVLPSTPSSAGTIWRHPASSALIATPLRTVSRAMLDCTWDLSDTFVVDTLASPDPASDPSPQHRVTYHSPPPLPTDVTTSSSFISTADSHATRSAQALSSSVHPPSRLPPSQHSMGPLDPSRASEPVMASSHAAASSRRAEPASFGSETYAVRSALAPPPRQPTSQSSSQYHPSQSMGPRDPSRASALITATQRRSTSPLAAVHARPLIEGPDDFTDAPHGSASSVSHLGYTVDAQGVHVPPLPRHTDSAFDPYPRPADEERRPPSPSIVTDTSPQRRSAPSGPIQALEDCLNQHMGERPDAPGASTPSLSELNDSDIKGASAAAKAIEGTGELSYYVEDYAGSLLRFVPGVRLAPILIPFVEFASAVMGHMDLQGYADTCLAIVKASPLESREQAATDAPSRILASAKERTATASSSRGMGSGPPVSHSAYSSRSDFSSELVAAAMRGQHAAQLSALDEQRRAVASERKRLEEQSADLARQSASLAHTPPSLAWHPPYTGPATDSASSPAAAAASTVSAHQPLPSLPLDAAVVTTVGPVLTVTGPPTPALYSDTMGGGRPRSHTKLRRAADVLASCSFDKASMKTPAFAKADLVKLIDCDADDFDKWLPARPEVLERMLKLYYQRFYTVIPGGFMSPSAAVADVDAAVLAAEETCRDLLRDAIAEAPKLSRVQARVRKARTAQAGTDCVFMVHCIDQHAVPSGSASISLTIQRRRLKIEEESIASFLEDLINLCASHHKESEVREKFVVAVSVAMDDAEASGLYNSAKIDHVRDNFLSDDAVLPASNDALREKLERTSSTNKAWQRVLQPPSPPQGRINKEARTHEGWGLQQPPPPQQPQSPPPHSPSLADQFQHQASMQEAAVNYGNGQQPPQRFGGQPYGGRGYGGGYQGRGGYGGHGYDQQYSQPYGKGDGKGGGQSYGGSFDGGKGKGKGKGAPKDPNALTKFYDFVAIIATGLIWPKDTKLYWSNPARINADGSGDGLYGCDCPLCGKNKKRAFTWEEFKAHFGKYPGTGPDCMAQPEDVVVYHRGLGCKESGWEVQRYVRDHPDAPECMKTFMNERDLAEFKARVPS